ncbi:MAG: DUF4352 domain-containing protein [Eubacterium sp.]|nr:DUF4352 domain-containing protein [Eubacterium sp.]
MEKEKKKGKLKWVIIAIVAVVVVFAIASGGDDDSDEVAKKTGQVETEQTSSDAKEDNKSESEEKSEFKVGDVVETSDLKISYLSAKKYKTDNEFMQPKKGNVYYRMQFEFENIGDSDESVTSLADWECYADGYSVEQQYFDEDELDGNLSPGKKAKGSVYFEVPKDAKEIKLEYETEFWSSKKIVFVVK